MGLLYPANTHPWQAGDLVIHDADANRADMPMLVLSCSLTGIYESLVCFANDPRFIPYPMAPPSFAPRHRPCPASGA